MSRGIRFWQRALIGFGIATLVVGGLVLLAEVDASQYVGIGVWLVGALILHDGIAAMVVFGVTVALRRTATRVPNFVVVVVQGALAIAAIVTLLVLPEIVKQSIGTANPSILPLDYALNLVWFHLGLATVAGVLIIGYLALRRRRSRRPRSPGTS